MVYDINRRDFLEKMIQAGGVIFLPDQLADLNSKRERIGSTDFSNIYVSRNGSPDKNLAKVMQMMGGIESVVGQKDIVILKPNSQWWNQGTTNISAMKEIIHLILRIPSFTGEIIIADNHQKYIPDSRGWSYKNVINGDSDANNLNQLVSYFNNAGFQNVTKYHWQGYDKGGKVVTGPSDGDGYVQTHIEYTRNGKATIMTYPIFTSSFSDITIDYKNGAWKNDVYINRKITVINMAGLNHHSRGATSALKNHMGIVELPADDYQRNEFGRFPDGHYNFHSIGSLEMGGALGTFLNTIRYTDLNIVTAEWVGWGNRVDPEIVAHAKTILASRDPVALDYWGTKNILYPFTPDDCEEKEYHHPENTNGHLWKYLWECTNQDVGTMNESEMNVTLFNFNANAVDEKYVVSSGKLALTQNYHNPFNDSTYIKFILYKEMKVSVRILDIYGRRVKNLIHNRTMMSSQHTIQWHGDNHRGVNVSSGIYLCEVISEDGTCSIKLIKTK